MTGIGIGPGFGVVGVGGGVSSYSPLTTSIEMTGAELEYVGVPRFAAIDFDDTDPCSMGVWVKYTSGGDQIILAKEWVSGVSQGWVIRITDTDIYAAYQPKGLAGNVGYSRWGVSHNDGEWHLILFTWDGSTAPTIYVDGLTGTLGTGSSTSALFRAGTTGNLNFGRKNDGSYFTGKMCHGFIYDKELSQAEVDELYTNSRPQDLTTVGPTANLVWWSALGDGDAIGAGNIIDLSTGGNDGTYVNGDSGDFVSDTPP